MAPEFKAPLELLNRALLWCGVIAGPLFMTAVLIEGQVRAGYSSFLYPLSSLSMGHQGWAQIANFIFTGTLLVAFAVGLRRLFPSSEGKFRGPFLLGFVGVGLIGAGLFVTDPLFGYPTDQPLVLRQFTLHGHLHDAVSMLVFICLPWAGFSFRKRFKETNEPGWATYSAITAYAMIATFVAASLGFKQVAGFVAFAGLFQRLCIASGLIWIALLALHFVKAGR